MIKDKQEVLKQKVDLIMTVARIKFKPVPNGLELALSAITDEATLDLIMSQLVTCFTRKEFLVDLAARDVWLQ